MKARASKVNFEGRSTSGAIGLTSCDSGTELKYNDWPHQLIKDDEEDKDENSTIVCTNYTSKIDGKNKTECKDTELGKPVFDHKDNAEPLREVNIVNSSANGTADVWEKYRFNQTAKRLNNTKQEELKKGDDDVKAFS